MQLLRSLLFAVLFYPGTVVFVLCGMAASLFGPAPTMAVVEGWAAYHHWLTRYLVGIRVRVEGVVPAGPYLVAAKHQAMFETIELLRLVDRPIIVLKRELAYLPLFGWMTRRWGVIPVEREAGAKALRDMLAESRKAKATGRPVIIYPEGTRVRPGETPPLRPGFAGLYRALGMPVVPIALDSGRLWGRGLVKKSGTVTVHVGEIIPAGLKREEIEARVHAAINALEPSAP
jgi:1-acyl-sn-glycerol-3-phosphate acyltransferase